MSLSATLGAILGAGGLLTGGGTAWYQFRDRKRSVQKQEGSIKLDDTTRNKIAAEAAQINSDVAIAQQNWWREQFDVVRAELTEEQKLRRRLTRWATEHQEWDQRAWTLALETDPMYPGPPNLELDDQ